LSAKSRRGRPRIYCVGRRARTFVVARLVKRDLERFGDLEGLAVVLGNDA
jgi:hypothetical protein